MPSKGLLEARNSKLITQSSLCLTTRILNRQRFAGVSEAGVPSTRGVRVMGWEAGARSCRPERSEGSPLRVTRPIWLTIKTDNFP